MKKIITAVAAMAMAASVFAVELTGALKVGASVLDVTKEENKDADVGIAKLTGIANGGMYYDSRLQVAVYADRAGAQFRLVPGSADWGQYKLWIQPVNMLKVNLGSELAYKVNGGDWWMTINDINWEGFSFDLTPVEGLSINLAMKSVAQYQENKVISIGEGDVPVVETKYDKTVYEPWFKPTKDGIEINETALYAKYSADFGGIGAGFIYNGHKGYQKTGKSFKVSAGYDGKFGPVDMFADVALDIDAGAEKALTNLAADAFANYTADALGIKFYTQYKNDFTKEDAKEANTLLAYVKGSYNLGAATVYCEVRDNDFIANDFAIQVVPGATFNIGAASCEVKADMNFSKAKTTVSVPFTATVSF